MDNNQGAHEMTRTCQNPNCDKTFVPRSVNHWFCCDKCRRSARGPEWGWVRRLALKRDSYRCAECGKMGCRLEVHHIVFVCFGGKSTLDNVITLCVKCHHQKHKDWREAYAMAQDDLDKRVATAIAQLATMADLVAFRGYIGRKTKYGDKPGPGPWYFTERLLREYAPATDLQEFTGIFESIGAHDEITAAELLVLHDKLVP